MPDKIADSRLAVCISRIPDSVPVEDLALLPSDDQPCSDVFANYYQERRRSFYSICIAVTRRGVMQRALEFVNLRGGVAHLDTFDSFLEARRGKPVSLRRVIEDANDFFQPIPYISSPLDIPFVLVTKTLWSEQQTKVADTKSALELDSDEGSGDGVSQSDLPLSSASSLADTRALVARRRVGRLEGMVRKALTQRDDIDKLRKQLVGMEPSPQDLTEGHQGFEQQKDREYEKATDHAYLCMLALDRAREEAGLAEEIAQYQKHFICAKHPEPDSFIKYTLIYEREGTSAIPFPPEELPRPDSKDITSKRGSYDGDCRTRWLLRKSLSAGIIFTECCPGTGFVWSAVQSHLASTPRIEPICKSHTPLGADTWCVEISNSAGAPIPSS